MEDTVQVATDAAPAGKRAARKVLQGVVVSAKMDKTIVVSVSRVARHPLYHKVMHIRKKFYAHDPDNTAKAGDQVEIASSRPLSKLKRWRLVKVLEQGARG